MRRALPRAVTIALPARSPQVLQTKGLLGDPMLCAICRSDSIREVGAIQGYRQNSFFRVIECTACGASSADPLIVDTKLYEAIYKNVRKVPGYSRYHSLAEEIERQVDPLAFIAQREESYFAIVDALRKHFPKARDVEICEVGCGQGYFTFALRKAAYAVTGVDHSVEAVDLARKRYGDFYYSGSLNDYVRSTPRRPNFIFACEVIEHLQDPVAFVAEALESLPSGGVLAVTTPNKLQNGDISTRSVWDTELPPIHLWWLTKSSLAAIGKRLDCPVSFTDFTDFYRVTDGFLKRAEARTPIFDESYNLIQAAPAPGRLAPVKKAIRKLLPTEVVRRLRRLQMARLGTLGLRDDATSETIGALFKKP
jgi:SAM-dependent methyltransferase